MGLGHLPPCTLDLNDSVSTQNLEKGFVLSDNSTLELVESGTRKSIFSYRTEKRYIQNEMGLRYIVPDDPDVKSKLKKFVNKKVILVLKTFDKNNNPDSLDYMITLIGGRN